MPLTGQAKTDYQRAYMRRRRSNAELLDPKPRTVRPYVRPKPQSFNPMMVGYIPPQE